MDHFSEQSWADFARGVDASDGIKAHLAAGCLTCKTAQGFWARLENTALAEASYSAPEDLVRLAKLEFSARQELDHSWAVASKVFDTFSLPLLVGVRNGVRSGSLWPRQVVYEAEGLTVDLRFERATSSGKISATGQILDNRAFGRNPLNAASIVLWTGDGQLVATTVPNPHGEFQLEFVAQDDLRLTARVGGRRVRMSLVDLK
jgi:hypothetical protein